MQLCPMPLKIGRDPLYPTLETLWDCCATLCILQSLHHFSISFQNGFLIVPDKTGQRCLGGNHGLGTSYESPVAVGVATAAAL